MPARSLLALLLLAASAGAPQPEQPLLRRLVEKGRHPAIHWGRFSDVQAEARQLYDRNSWAPLWLTDQRPTPAAHALLDALATAADRGLDPEDYDAAQLAALAATLERGGADAEQAIRFDAALTIGALRLVLALARGRIAPREAHITFSTSRTPFDPAITVDALRHTDHPDPILLGLEPSWSPYRLLKRALARYRQLERDTLVLRLPRPRLGGVRVGDRYNGAASLRLLLSALGDLAPERRVASTGPGDTLLTAELGDGIQRFQIRQGAPGGRGGAGGVLDEATWIQLTRQLAPRIRQMELALERWRWLPREGELTGVPIYVSIPAFRLHYFTLPGDAEQNLVRMSVRVGSGFPREQPVFGEVLSLVVFQPSPRTAAGPSALGTVRFPLSSHGALCLYGTSVDESVDRDGSDTGCLRVADGELLAELLLRDRSDWSPEHIQAAMAGMKRVAVRLTGGVPVLIVYGTAVARENGQVFFSPDVYGHDQRLELLLRRGYPYPR